MNVNVATFANLLPPPARPYAPFMLANADDVVSPFLIYGLGSRETEWGASFAYKKDTGDWSPRLWSHDHIARFPHVNVVGQKNGLFLVMPADGLGWGRGLLQLDFVAEYAWLSTHDWQKPETSIARGIEHLRSKFAFFAAKPTTPTITVDDAFCADHSTREIQLAPGIYPDTRPFVGGALEAAAVASYNADFLHVLRAIAAGGIVAVDVCTTEHDYSSDVRNRAAALQIRYANAA